MGRGGVRTELFGLEGAISARGVADRPRRPLTCDGSRPPGTRLTASAGETNATGSDRALMPTNVTQFGPDDRSHTLEVLFSAWAHRRWPHSDPLKNDELALHLGTEAFVRLTLEECSPVNGKLSGEEERHTDTLLGKRKIRIYRNRNRNPLSHVPSLAVAFNSHRPLSSVDQRCLTLSLPHEALAEGLVARAAAIPLTRLDGHPAQPCASPGTRDVWQEA
ncbi:hypothetical protein AAFF_G00253110 [Aldrovandia affinis]|uniref:Uncharacterized protein n=1 Tax=Aldrovandia affinis TaxID=143900 RepID=A0AAD7STY4_9TELE|nr:hypothetical protein AAFF_G00253110 [Aldrovandia affinis]